ncbi:hypothetical protein EG328_003972 [Venturia inaequalis]|uniref:Uncharacterized protein n=1 Tax=Venturia inaequalis TaxID=5025 RepID=A0A8H3U154_VENIN|nr:hypothetical protein EG328_003972 [Venturia inaequalis]
MPYSLHNPPLAVRLGNLAKLYTEDMKYGGEEFKSLKGKSIIFEDIATKVGITQMQDIVSVFPQVLKDKARDFYYEEIIDRKYKTINKLYQETIDPKEFSIRTDITIVIEDLDFDPEDDLQEDLHRVDALPLEVGVVDTQIRILLDAISFQAAPGSSNSSKKVLATFDKFKAS